MMDPLLVERSLVMLQHCLRIRPKDNMLIVADRSADTLLVDALTAASVSLGAVPHTLEYAPGRYMFERDYCRFGGAWQLEGILSPVVGAALKTADCAIFLNSDMDVFFSPHLRAALETGTRIILLCYIIDRDRFLRLMPETLEEIKDVKETTERYLTVMRKARHARLTSPGGTDIEMILGENRAGCSVGVVGTGEGGFVGGMELLPAGQVICCPDKGTVNGKLVLDRSLMAHEYTRLYESVELTVKNGYVEDIRGGNEAERLKTFLESLGDREIYNVTELGIGTNPRCRFAGICAPAEDTHARGSLGFSFFQI